MSEKDTLREDQFIQESYNKDPWSLWLFLLLTLGIAASIWMLGNWREQYLMERLQGSEFHQVTNRETSLFLWQNPEFMRVNRKGKAAYLPDFDYQDRVTLKPTKAERTAQLPPAVLFRYHSWKRLVGDVLIPREIPLEEFREFLRTSPEWQPVYWETASADYVDLVENFENWDQARLPKVVQQAFFGWKNYFLEGEEINKLRVTADQLRDFLRRYPNYERHHWRNIFLKPDGHSPYLEGLSDGEVLEGDDLPAFLRTALYNDLVSQ